eukprot:TRINITY_DN386_c0_g2_i1.p1 TRINITY_DN386_c0_g2~~TRINITY_DN386_c0_g2_i1.p1  ORF type:complete len:271 (-),score=81.59 TRINITY_DN386_c0_g2_i1:196-957(-)
MKEKEAKTRSQANITPNQEPEKETIQKLLWFSAKDEIETDTYDISIKVVTIGDSNTGKSTVLHQWKSNDFSSMSTTIALEVSTKAYKVEKNNVNVQLWDTAGQERFRAISRTYYRGARGVILIFDVTNRESYEHIHAWLEEVRSVNDPTHQMCFLLIGNKIDLPKREVETAEALAFAKREGMAYIETSAKNGTNCQRAIQIILNDVYTTCYSTNHLLGSPPAFLTTARGQNIVLEAPAEEKERQATTDDSCAC